MNWFLIFIWLFMMPKEVLLSAEPDPRSSHLEEEVEEPDETLFSKGEISPDKGNVSLGPYFFKKGAGIKITIPF
jgi:hypothetical protein